MPPDVEKQVSNTFHLFDWVTERNNKTDEKLYEGRLMLVFKKVIIDLIKNGTFFYNRGFREGVKFQHAVSELRRL